MMLLENFSFFSCLIIFICYDDYWNTHDERCIVFPYHQENLIDKPPLEQEIRVSMNEMISGKTNYLIKNITCSPIQRELYSITEISKCF